VYVEAPLTPGSTVTLPPDTASHLAKVLRARSGDELILFNGDGRESSGAIESVRGSRVSASVGESRPVDRESPLAITLMQCVPRGDRMDFIVQKATELGVAAHWIYKQQAGRVDGRQYRWLREMLDILETASNPEEFLEHTKLEMFQDQVFAFTPKGDLIALPRGATPVDFAYAVHSQIGDTCVGAKINGRLLPLRTELANGDQRQRPFVDDLLVLASLLLLLGLLVLVLSGVENFSHAWFRGRIDLNQVKTLFFGKAESQMCVHNSEVGPITSDEANLWNSDLSIGTNEGVVVLCHLVLLLVCCLG
jgi:hypothetical protein